MRQFLPDFPLFSEILLPERKPPRHRAIVQRFLKKIIESAIDKEKILQSGRAIILEFMERSEKRMAWRLQSQE
jgi:hypothetical protein